MSTRFEIYRDGERVTSFEPVAAMAMGPESVPVPGEVFFRDGYLTVTRQDEHAAGVALMWDVGATGVFHLETTRLPPRTKPYNLNVELARLRLMKIVQKQEDWNLFDFPKAERFATKFKEAQMLLADALGKLDQPAVAAGLADQSLVISVDLSEQLAAFHAELLINRRRSSGTFVKHIFGCGVDQTVQNQKYKDMLAGQFDYAVMPMSWKQLQPAEGVFNVEPTDEWIEMLSRKRLPMIGGPLINFDPAHVPEWMFIWEHDYDTLRELAYDYVQKVVQRYRRAISVWNVVSGVHTNSAFILSFEQVIELTRLLVSQVKTLMPSARTLVTVSHPFGEYHAKRASVPPMLYAEMVAQSGINFEAFSLELEMGVPRPGMFSRDLFQLSCVLDKFATLGRPVFLTAVGAPGRNSTDPNDQSGGKQDPSRAGRWHRAWDPDLQAEWLEAVYRVALSKPYVESIAWNDLADIKPALPSGGLMDDLLQPKPSFVKLQELREKFHQWSGKK